MPELEAKVTGGTYTQRSVPQDSLVLGKGIPVIDESGHAIGHFSGLVIGAERRIEQLLVDQGTHPAIPVDQLISCTEDHVQVRRVATP